MCLFMLSHRKRGFLSRRRPLNIDQCEWHTEWHREWQEEKEKRSSRRLRAASKIEKIEYSCLDINDHCLVLYSILCVYSFSCKIACHPVSWSNFHTHTFLRISQTDFLEKATTGKRITSRHSHSHSHNHSPRGEFRRRCRSFKSFAQNANNSSANVSRETLEV